MLKRNVLFCVLTYSDCHNIESCTQTKMFDFSFDVYIYGTVLKNDLPANIYI